MNTKPILAFAALAVCTGAFGDVASQKQPTGKTRADVQAEAAEARRTGELDRIRGEYYGLPDRVQSAATLGFAAAPPAGNTRAQVRAELDEARRSGELERLRQSYEGIDMQPQPSRKR
jgi:hypothetical protein